MILLSKTNKKNYRAFAGKCILFSGVSILIATFSYMISNIELAETFVKVWLGFVGTGLLLIVISQMVRK